MSKKYMGNCGLDAETKMRLGWDVPGYHEGMGLSYDFGPYTSTHQLLKCDSDWEIFKIPEESIRNLSLSFMYACLNCCKDDPDQAEFWSREIAKLEGNTSGAKIISLGKYKRNKDK
jgi:hypothetical protein